MAKTTKKKQTKATKKSSSTRKIIGGLFISVDGVTESPNEWQETFDQEMGEALGATLAEQDAILMGRKTYEEWANYWPENTTDEFAGYINNVQKYVVSSTLDKVEWGKFTNITLLKDLDEVKKIKSLKGKNIGMSGSTTLVASLIKADLLDELFLMIHPVIVGKGKRIFDLVDELKRLKVVSSETSSSGTIMVKYAPQ